MNRGVGRLAMLALAGLLAACAHAAPPAPVAGLDPRIDSSCRVDSDCAVKDIGSCCGYYPACVNKDSPTFAEQLAADCLKNNGVGVCGFPVIKGCQCVQQQCVPGPATGELR